MIRAKNEVKNLTACVESVRTKLGDRIEHEFVICDNGSTDGTQELARRLFAEKSDGRIVSYPFQLGKPGAELHLTPVNSVHNIAWSCQYLMLQTRPYSHLFIWDADFEMTDALAARLVDEFCNKTSPEAAYTIAAIDYDGVVNRETFLFSSQNLPMFNKFWMWKIITYSQRGAVRFVDLPESECILHRSTLKNVKSFQTYSPWWRLENQEQYYWHKPLDEAFRRLCEHVLPTTQLFCRYCDPRCETICQTFPRVVETINGLRPSNATNTAHKEPHEERDLRCMLRAFMEPFAINNSDALATNLSSPDFFCIIGVADSSSSAKRSVAIERRARFLTLGICSENRPAFSMAVNVPVSGVCNVNMDWESWLAKNAGIRRFNSALIIGSGLSAQCADVYRRIQLIQTTMLLCINRPSNKAEEGTIGRLFLPGLLEWNEPAWICWLGSLDRRNGVGGSVFLRHSSFDYCALQWGAIETSEAPEKMRLDLPLHEKSDLGSLLTLLVPTHAKGVPSSFFVAMIVNSLFSFVNQAMGLRHNCFIRCVVHFDHHGTPRCDRYLHCLRKFLLSDFSACSDYGSGRLFSSTDWNEKFRLIKQSLQIELLVSRDKSPSLGIAQSFVRLMDACQTPLYCMWEHDWQFCDPTVDLDAVLTDLIVDDQLSVVRFNKRENAVAAWDTALSERTSNLCATPMVSTNAFSNNPHFGKIERWRNKWRPILFANENRSPNVFEDVLDRALKQETNYVDWGICIYGSMNRRRVVTHMDGKTFESDLCSKGIIITLGDNTMPANVLHRTGAAFGNVHDLSRRGTQPDQILDICRPLIAANGSVPIVFLYYHRYSNSNQNETEILDVVCHQLSALHAETVLVSSSQNSKHAPWLLQIWMQRDCQETENANAERIDIASRSFRVNTGVQIDCSVVTFCHGAEWQGANWNGSKTSANLFHSAVDYWFLSLQNK